MEQKFYFGKDIAQTQADKGVMRKILTHSPTMMMVEIDFEKDAIGSTHTHPHEQMTYIISGKFRFTNDGETQDVGPGDSIRFAPDVSHGTVCLEAGRLVDVFTPCREDFLA